jgi:Peptidase_C39 like family
MRTGLWVATSRLAPAALLEHIPPACHRRIELILPTSQKAGDADVLVEGPEWPVEGATHFVPSLAVMTELSYSARLELSVRVSGSWSAWTAGVGLGPASFPALSPADGLDADIDVFRSRAPVEAARVRFRVRGAEATAVLAMPWMLALSASDGSPVRADAAPAEPGVRLDVPARSQMEADPEIARRICSPTCVAMVLDFWRRPVRLDALAADMFNPAADLYGVWPAAIAAAGRRGLAGYVLRFPDWASASWCLRRGLPIIASVRYAAGELTDAAVSQTPGHLLTLTGSERDEVLVNDPGAPAAASVARRYRLDELARVWLERTGVGYVIFPLATERFRGG